MSAKKVLPWSVWVEVSHCLAQILQLLFSGSIHQRLCQQLRLKFSVLSTGSLDTCSHWLAHTTPEGIGAKYAKNVY